MKKICNQIRRLIHKVSYEVVYRTIIPKGTRVKYYGKLGKILNVKLYTSVTNTICVSYVLDNVCYVVELDSGLAVEVEGKDIKELVEVGNNG